MTQPHSVGHMTLTGLQSESICDGDHGVAAAFVQVDVRHSRLADLPELRCRGLADLDGVKGWRAVPAPFSSFHANAPRAFAE
jgi:hypothetical protein